MSTPTTESWYFVYDTKGQRLAAFPERDLAEAYSENTGWAIRKEPLGWKLLRWKDRRGNACSAWCSPDGKQCAELPKT